MNTQKQFTYVITILLSFFSVLGLHAQKSDRDFIRRGNRQYKDSLFNLAETNYLKAIELNPSSVEAAYNLGNTLLIQDKTKEALEQYQVAAKIEKSTPRLAQIHHNAGVALQQQKQLAEAIEMYKEALRKNPHDHETRYNLALCQHQLKNNEQENQGDNQDQEGQDNKEQEDKQNQDNKEENKEQENKEQENEAKEEQNNQPQPQPQNEISKQNAEQLLEAILQDEKEVQEKVQRAKERAGNRKLQQDW